MQAFIERLADSLVEFRKALILLGAGVAILLAIPLLTFPSAFGFVPCTYPDRYSNLHWGWRYLSSFLAPLSGITSGLPSPEPIGEWKIIIRGATFAFITLAFLAFRKGWKAADRVKDHRKWRPERTRLITSVLLDWGPADESGGSLLHDLNQIAIKAVLQSQLRQHVPDDELRSLPAVVEDPLARLEGLSRRVAETRNADPSPADASISAFLSGLEDRVGRLRKQSRRTLEASTVRWADKPSLRMGLMEPLRDLHESAGECRDFIGNRITALERDGLTGELPDVHTRVFFWQVVGSLLADLDTALDTIEDGQKADLQTLRALYASVLGTSPTKEAAPTEGT